MEKFIIEIRLADLVKQQVYLVTRSFLPQEIKTLHFLPGSEQTNSLIFPFLHGDFDLFLVQGIEKIKFFLLHVLVTRHHVLVLVERGTLAQGIDDKQGFNLPAVSTAHVETFGIFEPSYTCRLS